MGENDGIDDYCIRDSGGQPVPYTFEEKRIPHQVRDIMTAALVAKSRNDAFSVRAKDYPVERAEQIEKWIFGLGYSTLLSGLWPFAVALTIGGIYLMDWWSLLLWAVTVGGLFAALGIVNMIRLQHSGAYAALKSEQLIEDALWKSAEMLFLAHLLFWLFPLTVPAMGTLLALRLTSPRLLLVDPETAEKQKMLKDPRAQSALLLKEHVRVMNGLAMLLRTEERIRNGAGARVLGKRPVNLGLVQENLRTHREKAMDHIDFIVSVASEGKLGEFHGDLGTVVADSLESIQAGTALLGDGDAQRQMQIEVLQLQMLGG